MKIEIMPDVVLDWEPDKNEFWNNAKMRGFELIKKVLSEQSYSREEVLDLFAISEQELIYRTGEYDVLDLYEGKYFPKFQFIGKEGSTPTYFALFNAAFLKMHGDHHLSLWSFWFQEGYAGKNNFEMLKNHDVLNLYRSLRTHGKHVAR